MNSYNRNNQGFPVAALCCGILSITLGCCGLSIPCAALGLLFVSLAKRKGVAPDFNTAVGKWLSIIGLAFGILSILYVLYMLRDPAFVENLNQTSRQLYGMDLHELMQYYQ